MKHSPWFVVVILQHKTVVSPHVRSRQHVQITHSTLKEPVYNSLGSNQTTLFSHQSGYPKAGCRNKARLGNEDRLSPTRRASPPWIESHPCPRFPSHRTVSWSYGQSDPVWTKLPICRCPRRLVQSFAAGNPFCQDFNDCKTNGLIGGPTPSSSNIWRSKSPEALRPKHQAFGDSSLGRYARVHRQISGTARPEGEAWWVMKSGQPDDLLFFFKDPISMNFTSLRKFQETHHHRKWGLTGWPQVASLFLPVWMAHLHDVSTEAQPFMMQWWCNGLLELKGVNMSQQCFLHLFTIKWYLMIRFPVVKRYHECVEMMF